MESYSGDYSDYENTPGGLATFGATFCDYESGNFGCDYATMAHGLGALR